MPLAKIHVLEGRYDQSRMAKVSAAIQAALMNTLRVPPEDFYQLIFELPKNHFLHTPSFVGVHYTDDLIILDLTFIQGRPKETRLPTTLAASESDGGLGVKMVFERHIVWPDGHREIEGVTPKQLPSPSPVSVENKDQPICVEKPSQNSASDDQ